MNQNICYSKSHNLSFQNIFVKYTLTIAHWLSGIVLARNDGLMAETLHYYKNTDDNSCMGRNFVNEVREIPEPIVK